MVTNNFLEWLSGAALYVGYARYSQLGGHGFVIATAYDESDALREAINNLDAGDNEALDAERTIEAMVASGHCWYANHPDPVIAMATLMDQLREHHRRMSIEQEIAAYGRAAS